MNTTNITFERFLGSPICISLYVEQLPVKQNHNIVNNSDISKASKPDNILKEILKYQK